MTWFVTAVFVTASLLLLVFAMKRYPRLYCVFHGHVPRCSIENCGVIKFTCDTCHREVQPE